MAFRSDHVIQEGVFPSGTVIRRPTNHIPEPCQHAGEIERWKPWLAKGSNNLPLTGSTNERSVTLKTVGWKRCSQHEERRNSFAHKAHRNRIQYWKISIDCSHRTSETSGYIQVSFTPSTTAQRTLSLFWSRSSVARPIVNDPAFDAAPRWKEVRFIYVFPLNSLVFGFYYCCFRQTLGIKNQHQLLWF